MRTRPTFRVGDLVVFKYTDLGSYVDECSLITSLDGEKNSFSVQISMLRLSTGKIETRRFFHLIMLGAHKFDGR